MRQNCLSHTPLPFGHSPYFRGRIKIGLLFRYLNSSPKLGEVAAKQAEGYNRQF